MEMGPRIFLGAESFFAGRGGIARLARLTAKVLGEEAVAGRLDVSCLALSDEVPSNEFGVNARTAKGSRVRFVYEANRAALRCTHFVYDFLGMARAHCRIPLLTRPFMVWICGVDVWENAAPHRIDWARRANTLLSISNYTRERADLTHGGFERAKVCWLGTETNEPAAARKPMDRPPTVLILGRMNEREGYKGHAELIECWPKVVSQVPDARLVIAGSGPGEESIQRLASMSPSAARIQFRGFVPEDKMDALWAEASVFAMPSWGEGFGLVYIESMRHSVPVIASIHDAGQEINLDEETGYNVNLDHPDELTERLIDLLKNPKRALEMGRKGQERWREHFSFSAFQGRFLPLLQGFVDAG